MGGTVSNRAIVGKADTTINTAALASGGILSPEQAQQFLQMTFDATPLSPLVRHEIRRAKTGELDKIGIGRRLLRKKTEGTDDGYRASVNTGKVEYSTTAVRLPWEITEETLRQNIEGQNFENIVTGLMTKQVGCDTEDLCLNGDTSVTADTATAKGVDAGDVDFININDGWIKQIKDGGHNVDAASAEMSLDLFYKTLRAVPNKYNNGSLRWLMSPHRSQEWQKFILEKAVNNGGIITDSRIENPIAIPKIEVPSMPDDAILLTDPKNLIEVNTYDIIIRKTVEGKEAIMEDKRFYVIHFDFDAVVEELDATAILTSLKAI